MSDRRRKGAAARINPAKAVKSLLLAVSKRYLHLYGYFMVVEILWNTTIAFSRLPTAVALASRSLWRSVMARNSSFGALLLTATPHYASGDWQ